MNPKEYPDLNLFRNEQILILKALNKYQSCLDAAAALRVTERTVHNKKKEHGIVWDGDTKQYVVQKAGV